MCNYKEQLVRAMKLPEALAEDATNGVLDLYLEPRPDIYKDLIPLREKIDSVDFPGFANMLNRNEENIFYGMEDLAPARRSC
jgi:hypothetical protein